MVKKTIEEMLNEVDYSHDKDYVPTEFALSMVNFIKLVNGEEGEENKTPVLHMKMFDQYVSGKRRIANLMHRGAAKSTAMEYLIFRLAAYGGELEGLGQVHLALYISDSIDNGVKTMRKNLQFRWENSSFLQKVIPAARFTDIEWQFTNADGVLFVVKAYGASTGVRGTRAQGKRPMLALLDDLVSDEDAKSPTILASIKDTVFKAVEYALHPTKNMIIWNGTPFNQSDPLYEAIESGAWASNVFPVCEKFPCSKAEFRGSWEDRFPYEAIKEAYDRNASQGTLPSFYQEMMLRIMSDEDKLILPEDIRYYNLGQLLSRKENFNFYITTDFATSEKQGADYSVISVWAYNNNGDWFWVDGICERQDMGKNMDALFYLAQKYRPMSVGIEVTGQQGGFIPWLMDEQMRRNIWFTLASKDNSGKPGIRPNTNKLQRFNVVVPWFKQGKMYFPSAMDNHKALKEMFNELNLASVGGFRSKHDDAIDTVSMLASMQAFKPGEAPQMKLADGVYSLVEPEEEYENTYIV
jgi:N4 gp68-like protein|nr:MAG TPA: large terminase [Caudoviricetes sp.]